MLIDFWLPKCSPKAPQNDKTPKPRSNVIIIRFYSIYWNVWISHPIGWRLPCFLNLAVLCQDLLLPSQFSLLLLRESFLLRMWVNRCWQLQIHFLIVFTRTVRVVESEIFIRQSWYEVLVVAPLFILEAWGLFVWANSVFVDDVHLGFSSGERLAQGSLHQIVMGLNKLLLSAIILDERSWEPWVLSQPVAADNALSWHHLAP